MSQTLEELDMEFRIKAKHMIKLAKDLEDFTIFPYCGVRSLHTQARLFRKTRTMDEINRKAQSLRDRGYVWFSQILTSVGPQTGKLGSHVTNAGPGESWHQYGLAVDCVPILDGVAQWEPGPHWQKYGIFATYCGLQWSGDWKSFKEMPHCQLQIASNPLNVFSPTEAKRRIVTSSMFTQ